MLLNISHADLVDLYRTQGIEAVKAQLDEVLKQEKYWDDYLKNKDTSLGYYESKQYLIFCEKNNKKLTLYKKQNESFTKVLDENVIIGEKMGDKHIEGDKRTPEGVYDLTSKITKLDSFYGPLALVTSYPNKFDKSLKKKGHGIWIHGMPLNQNREEYTKGCIALDNPELQSLDKNINVQKSVVMISEENMKAVTKRELTRIFAFIYSWKDAWKTSDIEKYLTFYSKDFKKANGANYTDFSKYKERLFSRNEDKLIHFSNINIMPYPNSLNKNMFKIEMDQIYKTRSYNFEGKKELYIELSDTKVSILSEG